MKISEYSQHLSKLINTMNNMIFPSVFVPFNLEILRIATYGSDLNNETASHYLHKHAHFEFHFPIRDGILYTFNDNKEITVYEDQFIVIPPFVEHSLLDLTPTSIKLGVGVTFPDDSSNNNYSKNLSNMLTKKKYLIGNQTPEMDRCLENIFNECNNPTFFSPYYISDLIVKLILEIAFSIDKSSFPLYRYDHNINDHRISMAKQFIKNNLNKPINSESVANYLFISTKQLNRIFQKNEHMTVQKYISYCKFNEATKLLLQTNKSIKEISYNLGFRYEKYFGTFFKKYTKIPPTEYRKRFGPNMN